MTLTQDKIAERLGQLTEGLANAKDDRNDLRSEVRDGLEKLSDAVDAMRLALNGLTSTSQAIASQVSLLGMEKCGERLDILERDREREKEELKDRLIRFEEMSVIAAENRRRLDTYQRWFGNGMAFLGKLLLGLISSAAIGGVIAKWWL